MNIITKEVMVKCDDGFMMRSIIIEPAEEKVFPAILFIAEPFGLNDEMQRVAKSFAQGGYVIIMPDLTSRGSFFSCIRVLMNSLKNGSGQSIDDLLSVRNFMCNLANVDSNKTAVLGLCMGGGFALILGKTGLFKVSAPFYGMTPDNLEGSCPIIASYGARDEIMKKHAEHLKKEVESKKIPHDIMIYESVGHSFMNKAPNALLSVLGPILPAHAKYDETAAQHATQRVLNFLNENI